MKKSKHTFSLVEAVQITGLDHLTIVSFIEHEWISPPEVETLDEEDIARIQFIQELRVVFGANDDAIPLILHLADQLYRLRNQVQKLDQNGP